MSPEFSKNAEKVAFFGPHRTRILPKCSKSRIFWAEFFKNVQKVEFFGQDSSKIFKKSIFLAHIGPEFFKNVQKVESRTPFEAAQIYNSMR